MEPEALAAHQAAKMGGRARVGPDSGGKNLSSPLREWVQIF